MAEIVNRETSVQKLGMATVRFRPKEYPGQVGGNGDFPVADFFVATSSKSPLILATGGNSEVPPAHTNHITVILAEPHHQGDQDGIRVRVNFVHDQPPKELWFDITLAQFGATEFRTPVMTTGTT